MCLYYKNKQNLTYSSEEHIFPAAVGGTKKLPKHSVSDQFNNDFSKIERIALTYGDIALTRMIEGPGSRGTKKIKNPYVITTIDNNICGLGYMFEGKINNINHFYIKGHNVQLIVDDKDTEDLARNEIFNFKKQLNTFNVNTKFVFIPDKKLNDDEIIVGFYDKFYVATNSKRPSSENLYTIIQKTLKNIELEKEVIKKELPQRTSAHKNLEINNENNRFYGKTAFNVLCYLKGNDFVLQKCFDNFRNWIIGEQYNHKKQSRFFENIIKKLSLPVSSHYCLFKNIDNLLVAIVCFYGYGSRIFILGEIPESDFKVLDGMICDWKNKKEMKLIEWLATL